MAITKNILLTADEEIIGSSLCQRKVCAIESARCALAAMGLLWALEEKGYYAANV
jgi:hypothetical protein